MLQGCCRGVRADPGSGSGCMESEDGEEAVSGEGDLEKPNESALGKLKYSLCQSGELTS